MPTKLQLHLAKIFLKIFLRDRQSIFFSLFFPIIFMTDARFRKQRRSRSHQARRREQFY